MTFVSLLVTMAALCGIVTLLLMASRWLPGLSNRLGVTQPRAVRIIAATSVGPRQGVAVLRIGERGLIVSTGEGGVRALGEVAVAELDEIELNAQPRRAPFTKAMMRAGMIAVAATFMSTGMAAAQQTAPTPAPASQPVAAAALGAVSGNIPKSTTPIDMKMAPGSDLKLTGTVGSVVVLGALTLLPTVLLLMTGFTRILVVLHFLRQALGTQTTPPGHLLAALALILTGFVMMPTLRTINQTALAPWMRDEINEGEMLQRTIAPLREFMLVQTPPEDVARFARMADVQVTTAKDIPTSVLASAFATSELRAAFQIGFAIFLPFVVIDLVVASILTSMGMFMLPPTMIALPCKLLLFVLVDGWGLVVQSLVASFR
jgi:flagellar biosynthesis protein FliP